ncbi:TetR family transcriptional regulator [Lacisediminihabitans profunda]|uniref:TetR family transcriptional regulator n=1 Tax=Lacisediminihabitans profunda TaxID=2594790 RepID=A0A5C8UUJ4_9MICO|nr:TetR family transcriptional regulator [Lacisediminihabitans profunda]TXN32304.1 TetR family transcriptional regulator [Lacisediminihabitans profunda]
MSLPETVGTRSTRHSRDDVVAAGLRILDEHGLPDLTMRRLAATLDVQPSALYWHFANKQTLLASIADQIVSRAAPAGRTDDEWNGTARAEAEALRDALLAFRDGAEVVSSTLALGLGADEAQKRLSRAIHRGGYDDRTSEIAAAALLHFILGHVSHEQQRIQADSLGVVALGHSADPLGAVAGDRGREAFDFGIILLLSGLELRAHARTKHT